MISKQERTLFTQAFVLLLLKLLVLSSAEAGTCSLTRLRNGDRIVFDEYSHYGACNSGVNPCQRIDGSHWKHSTQGCTCQCLPGKSTYREDRRSCVVNKVIRDGCSLLFKGERDTDSLRVFNNSSSLRFKTFPMETCAARETYYVTDQTTQPWKQLQSVRPAFEIHHENRKPGRHAHFLEWNDKQPVSALFGKIVKVSIECTLAESDGKPKAPRKFCIVFKIRGLGTLPCPVGLPSSTPPTSVTSTRTASTVPTNTVLPSKTGSSNKTTGAPNTDRVNVTVEPITTPTKPSIINKGDRESHDVGKKIALPIWLIAVIAGGAVIATLAITASIWICCKMKQRHRRRRKKRSQLRNRLYNNDDGTVINFNSSGHCPRMDEAGYAKVGSPCRKGYAFLEPGPERTRSEYQRLVKPGEDHSGYLLPMEERTPGVPAATGGPCTTDSLIYSEAKNPSPQDRPKDKEYDYAKPENLICLTASRSGLDNLDLHTETDPSYVEKRVEDNGTTDNGPSSPFYATVERPSLPGSPSEEGPLGDTLEEAPVEKDPEDHKPEYVELLPDTGSESGSSSRIENSKA